MKSDADDYRYFPDPDLVMLHITKEHIEEMKARCRKCRVSAATD